MFKAMKSIFSILLCLMLSASIVLAAEGNKVYLQKDSLPINLSEKSNWKYKQNDSVAFKLNDYNDQDWVNNKPTLYFDDGGKLDFAGLAWFRLTFFVDSNLVNFPLAIAMNHYGASEIYLNGILIKKYGDIKSSKETRYFDPLDLPFVFTFNKAGKQVIAIRYANYNAKRNHEVYNEPIAGFELKLGKANSMIESKNINAIALSSIFMLLTGFFISFCIIHFFMFLLNSGIRSNLYFSIFMLCVAIAFVIGFINFTVNNVDLLTKSSYYTNVTIVLIFVSLSGFVNELFSKNKTRFKIILVIGLISLLLQYFQNAQHENLMMFLIIFLLLETIFVVISAIKRKIKGAWIIGTGILFFTIFILTAVLVSITNDGELFIENSSIVGSFVIVCLVLTIISIPLSMSIYLAWNYATINKNLGLQLEQVQILSQKNLEQEQEKQRLLENRKAILEAQVLERTAELREEKKKSDDLLLNILPAEIAEELKQKGSATARDYEKVTVMFTDFKDFTKISEKLTPAALVKEIDLCFSAFDNIIQKHGIEKIKTIGDAYMCVGGLPVASNTHAHDVISAAIEIRDFMNDHNSEKALRGEHQFRIRIGIHTGSVVAGIVGVKKFAYDIWGDTVNIASRIESSGEPGKINISGSTYEIIKDQFNCSYRGKIEAKNKGEIDMYFVESL